MKEENFLSRSNITIITTCPNTGIGPVKKGSLSEFFLSDGASLTCFWKTMYASKWSEIHLPSVQIGFEWINPAEDHQSPQLLRMDPTWAKNLLHKVKQVKFHPWRTWMNDQSRVKRHLLFRLMFTEKILSLPSAARYNSSRKFGFVLKS